MSAPPVVPEPDPAARAARQEKRLAKRRGGRRLAIVYDVNGPKVRLGILWFLLVVTAMSAGRVGLAALFSLVAGVAALQVAAQLIIDEDRMNRVVAGGGAGLIGVSALLGTRFAGVAVLVVVVVAAAVASTSPDRDSLLDLTAQTVRSAVPLGLAAASVVFAHRVEPWMSGYLIAGVSLYEAGDFLVGTGARNRFEGPIAGMLGVAVLAFGFAGFEPPPTDPTLAWILGGVIAVCCPLGQLVGSLVLPRADARAPALRRLDSYLVAAPVFVSALWLIIALGRAS